MAQAQDVSTQYIVDSTSTETDFRLRYDFLILRSVYALPWRRVPQVMLPGLVQELWLAPSESILQPPLDCLIEDRQSVEEGNAVLWERVRIVRNA